MKGKAVEKEWVKIASRPLFNLYQSTMESSLWQIRLNGSGGYLRRRFHAPSLNHALEAAPVVAGLEKSPEERNQISLADAFAMALKNTNRREASRKEWIRNTDKFLTWLRKKHPLCTHWGVVTRQTIREYLATFDGLSDNHKRLSLQPVLQTAGYMYREHGFSNVGERMGIGSRLKNPPRIVYLEDVLSFCDFLRQESSHLEVGVALQGLAGLQLQEALRLTWRKVDLEHGLLEVSGEVKNEYRNRVIPACRRVLEAIRWEAERRAKSDPKKVVPVVDHVVVGIEGFGYEDHRSYSRQVRAALKRWNKANDWAPKDLRNCLPTFAKIQGIHGTIWEQYIGHAPETVTERHYVPRLAGRTLGEKNALGRQMDLFRRFVTGQIDAFDPAAGACNILHPHPAEGQKIASSAVPEPASESAPEASG